jgi:3-hydroxyisobutyrate dehydrogenase
MTKIGFIGLGHMGLPMAKNLIKAGFNVSGFDLQTEALVQFKKAGGTVCNNLAECVASQDVIITMLQTMQQVKTVCLAENGIFAKAKSQALWIDCSTVGMDGVTDLHQKASDAQLMSLDAPVSGGMAGAEAQTLTFMVGALDAALEKGRPILMAMGKKIFHTGLPGSGQAAKICNNMILGVSMIAISEAFQLGESLGLSTQKLFDVVNNASGQCWAMSHYAPVPGVLENVPANRGYEPGFSANMMLKDLLLSQAAAKGAGINTQMGALSAAMYQKVADDGLGELDFSAIIKVC